jgi:hypothetical protein
MTDKPTTTKRRDDSAEHEVDEPTNPNVPVYPGYVKGKIKRAALQMSAGIVVAAIAVCFAVFFALEARAEKRLEERVGPLETETANTKADVHELAKDIRELYRVTPRMRDSDRLERPFPSHSDGGAP